MDLGFFLKKKTENLKKKKRNGARWVVAVPHITSRLTHLILVGVSTVISAIGALVTINGIPACRGSGLPPLGYLLRMPAKPV